MRNRLSKIIIASLFAFLVSTMIVGATQHAIGTIDTSMDSTVAILDGVGNVVISDLPMPPSHAWCEEYGYGHTRLFKLTHPQQAWCTEPVGYSIKEQ